LTASGARAIPGHPHTIAKLARPGAKRPLHAFDSEQLWTVVEGDVAIELDGVAVGLSAGDSLVIPAGLERQISAGSAAQLLVCGYGDALVTVHGEPAPQGTPAWIA